MSSECYGLIGDEKEEKLRKKCVMRVKTLGKLQSVAGPLALLIALMIYTVIGGLIFRELELPSEIIRLEKIRDIFQDKRNHLIYRILNNTDLSNLGNLIKVELKSYELAMQEAAQIGSLGGLNELPHVVTERWSILQAIFFASTVLTTIGYGNVFPATHWGRIFCIFYAFVGIPLTLTVIAAWGKLFAETVSNLADKITTSLPPFLTFLIPRNITGRRSLGAFAAVVLLFIYLSCGAAMFMLWEDDWDFFDGFYFTFVTMTTIGFGDLVPKKPKYMLLCSLYILIGLALTGTIIELVRMQYSQSWQRLQALRGPLAEALKKLGEHAGGDMSTLQMDLKKVLAVVSMPKFRRKDGKEMKEGEWEEAVQAVLQEIEANAQNERQKIIQILIYESSV